MNLLKALRAVNDGAPQLSRSTMRDTLLAPMRAFFNPDELQAVGQARSDRIGMLARNGYLTPVQMSRRIPVDSYVLDDAMSPSLFGFPGEGQRAASDPRSWEAAVAQAMRRAGKQPGPVDDFNDLGMVHNPATDAIELVYLPAADRARGRWNVDDPIVRMLLAGAPLAGLGLGYDQARRSA